MKKITLIILILSTNFSLCQVVLDENFEAGVSIPAGWTNNDIASAGDNWIVESTGEARLATSGNDLIYSVGGATGNYAAFDSDTRSNNNLAENVALESPIFDCSSLSQVTLEYNHLFAGNFGGNGFVEVSADGGSNWSTLQSYSADNYDGGRISVDATAQLAGSSNAQVRFRWTGNWSVAWYVDNVTVFQCTVNAPDSVTIANNPANGATGVEITFGSSTNTIGPFEWNIPGTGDPAVSFNFNLGTNVAGDNIGTLTNFDNGGSINFGWQSNTTYYWSVTSVNCAGSTQSSVFSFTTEACSEIAAPGLPTGPSPADGATNVPLTSIDNGIAFTWTAGNGSDDFTLNFGTTNTASDVSFDNFQSGELLIGLDENTTYYWSLNALNCIGSTSGPVWSFTTGTALSVDEKQLELFTIYPNPTKDILNIKTNLEIEQIQILNLLGQNVLSLNAEKLKSNILDVSEFKSGIYIMKIKSDTKEQSVRFIKE